MLQFAKLADVVAQLGDDELRPNRDFQLQLVELHHLVGLVDFVGVHDGAGEEIEWRALDRTRPHFVLDARPHGLDQPEQQHRVQVVNWLGFSAEAFLLGIAGKSQNVFDALRARP